MTKDANFLEFIRKEETSQEQNILTTERLELSTSALLARCSNRLSYAAIFLTTNQIINVFINTIVTKRKTSTLPLKLFIVPFLARLYNQ